MKQIIRAGAYALAVLSAVMLGVCMLAFTLVLEALPLVVAVVLVVLALRWWL